jgi:hypothetical protein
MGEKQNQSFQFVQSFFEIGLCDCRLTYHGRLLLRELDET